MPTNPNQPPSLPSLNQASQNQDLEIQLPGLTGLEVKGALGGLPVAEKNQTFFAVFDEVGDTGPEIFDKTQFKITYLVDGELNTSKPAEGSTTALDATQNFEKDKTVVVRADNATVLNQNLSGIQTVYDVGTLKLISVTETGSSVGAYIPTMSFNNIQGQDIVSDAQNVSAQFTVNDDGTQDFGPDSSPSQYNYRVVNYTDEAIPISQSNGTYEWIDFESSQYYELLQDTTVAGTRMRFEGNVYIQVEWDLDNIAGGVSGDIKLERWNGSEFVQEDIKDFYIPVLSPTTGQLNGDYYYPFVNTGPFSNFTEGTRFRISIRKIGPSYHNIKIRGGKFKAIQEYTPGDVSVIGLNATTAPYFEPNYSTFAGDVSNNIKSYSILTSSVEFGNFADGTYTVQLEGSVASFDPSGDGNTFNDIITPFTFQKGDEIRFEFNKNKVHKIINVSPGNLGKLFLTVTPRVEENTEVNHFTHYRITPDGGYLILNVEKNNDVNSTQPFQGIILPQYPSTTIKNRQENLIFDLKQAGIIEN